MFITQERKECFKPHLSAVVFIVLCTISYTWAVSRPLDQKAYTIYYNNKPATKDGHFKFDFQTSNGITTQAEGNEYGVAGVVQYVSLEGIPYTMTYVADSDGYHPNGEHIPKTPQHVIKALEYIRTHPPVNEKESRKM